MEIRNKTVLVTGSTGFIGRSVCKELIGRGAIVKHLDLGFDLKNYNPVDNRVIDTDIDITIHLAGYNGGIAFNQRYPYDVFSYNTLMAINAINLSIAHKCKKFVGVLTSCGYPFNKGGDILEDTYLDFRPHPTIDSHGYAKRNLLLACQMAKRQYNLDAVCVVPNTVYGPGDSVDETKTKVMMAMIKRFVDAKNSGIEKVVCWGTGDPIREFIFIDDTAKLIVDAVNYEYSLDPLNISTGQFISIRDLANLIAQLVDYKGVIEWDRSKPDGQQQKVLNTDKMRSLFGEIDFTPLNQGIKDTINWYVNLIKNEGRL